jgi:hypothetical protein
MISKHVIHVISAISRATSRRPVRQLRVTLSETASPLIPAALSRLVTQSARPTVVSHLLHVTSLAGTHRARHQDLASAVIAAPSVVTAAANIEPVVASVVTAVATVPTAAVTAVVAARTAVTVVTTAAIPANAVPTAAH